MFRELVRKKQELSGEECIRILKAEPRGVLSVLGDDDYPYGMPMNYLYDEEKNIIYFHGGKNGHKIDALKRHDKASFCVYDQGYRKPGEWFLNISSVICFGRIVFIEDPDEIIEISRLLSLKYIDDMRYIADEIRNFASGTLCFAMQIEHMCGKRVKEK